MISSIYRRIINRASALLVWLLILGINNSFAAEGDPDYNAAVVVISPEGVVLNVEIVPIVEGAATDKITWSEAIAGGGWTMADQYFKISYEDTPPLWSIRIYTDNRNSEPPFSGKETANPAGLVNTAVTNRTLPMKWRGRLDEWPETGNDGIEKYITKTDAFRDGLWHSIIDKETPDDPTTSENEDFDSPEVQEYVTAWNQAGVAWHEAGRAGRPQEAHVYLATNLTMAMRNSHFKTTQLIVELGHEASPFPIYAYKEGTNATDLSYQYIHGKMDKYFAGDKLRLIESYSHPADYNAEFADLPLDDPLRLKADELSGKAFTYDNALAICALLTNPNKSNLSRAKTLCKSLMWAQANVDGDGSFRDAYDATQELKEGYTQPGYSEFLSSHSGNIAWAIIAKMQYYKNSRDIDASFKSQLLNAATSAGQFLHNNFYDNEGAGYFYLPKEGDERDDYTKSTENNIAIYAAFSHLYDVTEDEDWLSRANSAKAFVASTREPEEGEHRFIVGEDAGGNPNENTLACDVNLLAILGFDASTWQGWDVSPQLYLDYATDNFYTTYSTGSGCTDEENLIGVDFGYLDGQANEPDGVWFEGTTQLASVCKLLDTSGDRQNASDYLESIKIAQFSALYANYKGITAASDEITTGLEGLYYYPFPHIGTTSWHIAVSRGYNMLWGTSLSSSVPAPGDNISFTPEITEYPTEYLENHYAPSGWMGAIWNAYVDSRCTDPDDSENTCFKIHYKRNQWFGIIWQEPEGTWNADAGPGVGYDLRAATKLRFNAKASRSIEDVVIFIGYQNDSCGHIPPMPWDECFDDDWEYWEQHIYYDFTTEWQPFTIDIDEIWDHYHPGEELDMSHLAGGFRVEIYDPADVDIYLDDIRYETE